MYPFERRQITSHDAVTAVHPAIITASSSSLSSSLSLELTDQPSPSLPGHVANQPKREHKQEGQDLSDQLTSQVSYNVSSYWKNKIRELQMAVQEEKQREVIQKQNHHLQQRAKYLALQAFDMIQEQQIIQQHEIRWPTPSLSYSATRNYSKATKKTRTRSRDNNKQMIPQQGGNEDDNVFMLEESFHHPQFQQVWNVYIRLLETLDDIRNQGKEQVRLLIRQYEQEKIRKACSSSSTIHDTPSMKKSLSLSSFQYDFNNTTTITTIPTLESLLLEIHQMTHLRMKFIIQLSLHANYLPFLYKCREEHHHHHLVNKNPDQGVAISSSVYPASRLVPIVSTSRPYIQQQQQQQQQQQYPFQVNHTAFEHVSTEDILKTIYIRGNLPKRKTNKLPKRRWKVLEYFLLSYSFPLFYSP